MRSNAAVAVVRRCLARSKHHVGRACLPRTAATLLFSTLPQQHVTTDDDPFHSTTTTTSSTTTTTSSSSSSSFDSSRAVLSPLQLSTAWKKDHLLEQPPTTNTNDTIMDVVRQYARKPQTSASLQMLLRSSSSSSSSADDKDFRSAEFHGRRGHRLAQQRILLQIANFLRLELPVRLARRICDLDRVPLMRDMPSVQAVQQIYIDSFVELRDSAPIHTAMDEERFAERLEALYIKHSSVLVQMAKGAYELREQLSKQRSSLSKGKQSLDTAGAAKYEFDHAPPPTTTTTTMTRNNNSNNNNDNHDKQHSTTTTTTTTATTTSTSLDFARMQECHAFLDRFYLSRIGIRVLVGQYLALRAQQMERLTNNDNNSDNDGYIGMICLRTSPFLVVRQAAEDAKRMCRRQYGRAPIVHIAGRTDLTFPYIPTYLHYICLELLKNALRATCETHERELPPVTVIIADGTDNEDVVIKIADEGGGIPRSQVDKIWSYLFTTADPKIQAAFIAGDDDHAKRNNNDHCNNSPIAGLGYGLPISRSYCEYFGGALDVVSMEGYGTDAFIHLKRLGDSEEPLPV